MSVGVTLFGQQLGARKARKMLDSVIEGQKQDDELKGAMDDAWAQSERRMSRPQIEATAAALQQRASDVKLTERGSSRYLEQLATLRDGASPEDVKSYIALDSDVRFARDLVRGGHQEGFQLLAGVGQRIQSLEQANEQQRLKGEADEAAARAAMGDDNFNRRRELAGDYVKQSAPYIEASQGFQTLEGLYKSPADRETPAASQAAASAYMHIMNPGTAIRSGTDPGEDFWNDLPFGKVIQQVALNGATLTNDQWRSMYATASLRMAEHNKEQATRNTSAADAASKFLEPQYIDYILPITPLSSLAPKDASDEPAPVVPPREPGPGPGPAQEDSTATMLGTSARTGVATAAGEAFDFLNAVVPWPKGKRKTDEYVTAPEPRGPLTVKGVIKR